MERIWPPSRARQVEAAVVVDGSRDPVASPGFDELSQRARSSLTRSQRTRHGSPVRTRPGQRARGEIELCDCFAYALAKGTGEPLLFKGKDFAHTDVKQALP